MARFHYTRRYSDNQLVGIAHWFSADTVRPNKQTDHFVEIGLARPNLNRRLMPRYSAEARVDSLDPQYAVHVGRTLAPITLSFAFRPQDSFPLSSGPIPFVLVQGRSSPGEARIKSVGEVAGETLDLTQSVRVE